MSEGGGVKLLGGEGGQLLRFYMQLSLDLWTDCPWSWRQNTRARKTAGGWGEGRGKEGEYVVNELAGSEGKRWMDNQQVFTDNSNDHHQKSHELFRFECQEGEG